MCVVCSVTPDVNTAEITFHKLPSPADAAVQFAEWTEALQPALAIDASMADSYICSRHFQAADFAFVDGKLILLKTAIPSRIAKDDYDGSAKPAIEYAPSPSANNFATTLTKDHMTTSLKPLRGHMVCTETSRVLTPTVTEYITSQRSTADEQLRHGEHYGLLQATRKRNADLETKIQEFHKIFKRLHDDNLLTDTYVDQLKVVERAILGDWEFPWIFSRISTLP